MKHTITTLRRLIQHCTELQRFHERQAQLYACRLDSTASAIHAGHADAYRNVVQRLSEELHTAEEEHSR